MTVICIDFMTRNLDQILRDLEALKTDTTQIDKELQGLYRNYLSALGKAMRQQLILATYHICTQTYPEEFLRLSVAQREKLQTAMRGLARQGITQLEQLGDAILSGSDPADISPAAEAIGAIAAIDAQEGETAGMMPRWRRSLARLIALRQDVLSPVVLAKRHVLLENHLRGILQYLSSLSNHLLKEMQILPGFPDVLIAAAAETAARESGTKVPNLLNVLVEIDTVLSDLSETPDEEDEALAVSEESGDFEEEDGREMTHLVAIHLRLADIEFADPYTALWRGKIQEGLARLKRLGTRYHTLQQEQARAEAEHAWRAVWFEE
jgi:hypothetical protein